MSLVNQSSPNRGYDFFMLSYYQYGMNMAKLEDLIYEYATVLPCENKDGKRLPGGIVEQNKSIRNRILRQTNDPFFGALLKNNEIMIYLKSGMDHVPSISFKFYSIYLNVYKDHTQIDTILEHNFFSEPSRINQFMSILTDAADQTGTVLKLDVAGVQIYKKSDSIFNNSPSLDNPLPIQWFQEFGFVEDKEAKERAGYHMVRRPNTIHSSRRPSDISIDPNLLEELLKYDPTKYYEDRKNMENPLKRESEILSWEDIISKSYTAIAFESQDGKRFPGGQGEYNCYYCILLETDDPFFAAILKNSKSTVYLKKSGIEQLQVSYASASISLSVYKDYIQIERIGRNEGISGRIDTAKLMRILTAAANVAGAVLKLDLTKVTKDELNIPGYKKMRPEWFQQFGFKKEEQALKRKGYYMIRQPKAQK